MTSPLTEALRSSRPLLRSIAAFSVAMTLLLFVSPLYMMQVYDRVLQSRSGATLFFLTLIALALLVAYSLLDHARARMLARLGARVDYALSGPVLGDVLQANRSQGGAAAAQLIADCGKLRDFCGGPGMAAICDLPWAPVFLLICFFVHPLFGCLVAGGAAIVICLAMLSERSTAQSLAQVQAKNAAWQTSLHAMLGNADAMQALGMSRPLRERWSRLHEEFLHQQMTTGDRGGYLAATSKFVRQALQTGMLGTGAYLVLEGSITPGMMIAISIIGGKALTPVDQAVGQWKQLLGARQSYKRLQTFFAASQAKRPTTALPPLSGGLSVTGLCLGVPGVRRFILQDVTFALEPGEMAVVVGPSGSGKSSLLRSVVGAAQPLSGSVRLDGATLDQWDGDELGRQIGYLPQRAEMFPGTVAENISRFGRGAPERVHEAARALELDDFIRKLPGGYDTEVDKAARNLPAGLHQRLALARAFYGAPRIVVLDEPTNGLDYDGRMALLKCIRQLREDKVTILVVSQDQSIQLQSDKVIALSDGCLRAFRPTREMIVSRRGNEQGTARPATGTRKSDQVEPPLPPIMPVTGNAP